MDYQPKSLDIDQIEPRPIMDDITVVIPTLGRAILEESLYWILNGTAWPQGLIVVDQGANPQVAAWMVAISDLGIEANYVPSQQRGKAAALNRGIELATTRFILVTDDDCFVANDWLEKMLAHLHYSPHSIITGPAKAVGDEESVAVVNVASPVTSYRPGLKFDLFCGSNMGVEKNVIEQMGFFDEDLSLIAAEDCEWAYRALRSGVPIVYSPEIKVDHFSWRDTGQRDKRYQLYARSMGGFYGKYLRQGDGLIALRVLIHHLRALRRWLRGTITGDAEAALHGKAYFTNLLPGIIASLRRTKSL